MSIVNSIRSQLVPINAEGYPFIGAFALVSLILFWVWTPLGWIGTVPRAVVSACCGRRSRRPSSAWATRRCRASPSS